MRRERWNQYDYQRFSREPWQSCRLSSVGDAATGLRLDRLSTNLSATGLSNRKFKDSRLKLRESQRERERETLWSSTNLSPKTRMLKFHHFIIKTKTISFYTLQKYSAQHSLQIIQILSQPDNDTYQLQVFGLIEKDFFFPFVWTPG